jgi:hypothetical protein
MTLSEVERAHRHLRLASTLCYLQCVFIALLTLALGIPALAQGQPRASAYFLIAAYIAVSAAFGIAGRLLRKYRRSGALLTLGIISADILVRLLMHVSLLNVWLAVDAGIVILIALSWRHLETLPPPVSPPAT